MCKNSLEQFINENKVLKELHGIGYEFFVSRAVSCRVDAVSPDGTLFLLEIPYEIWVELQYK